MKHTCTSCRHAYQPCTLLSSTCGTFTLFCFIQILAWLHYFHCLTWICIDLFYSSCSLIPADVKSNAAAGGRKILLWSESLTLPVTQVSPEYVAELWMLFKKNRRWKIWRNFSFQCICISQNFFFLGITQSFCSLFLCMRMHLCVCVWGVGVGGCMWVCVFVKVWNELLASRQR